MPTSKRGGARAGAGRKPALTDLQRLAVGAATDRRLWRKTQADFVRSVNARFADDDLRSLWDGLEALRRDRRKLDPDALARHLADIEAEIEEGRLQGQRYFRGPIRIASGIRPPIVGRVARAASRLWRLPVSQRTAERCLEEYRAIKARADAELADKV